MCVCGGHRRVRRRICNIGMYNLEQGVKDTGQSRHLPTSKCCLKLILLFPVVLSPVSTPVLWAEQGEREKVARQLL